MRAGWTKGGNNFCLTLGKYGEVCRDEKNSLLWGYNACTLSKLTNMVFNMQGAWHSPSLLSTAMTSTIFLNSRSCRILSGQVKK